VQKADIRAVENPISATFDLASDVYDKAPKVRKMVTYSRAFIYLWLLLDFVLIVALAADPLVSLLLAILASAFLYSLRWAEEKEWRVVFLTLAAVVSFMLILLGGAAFPLTLLFVLLYFLGWIILDMLRDIRKFFDFYVVRHAVIKAVRDANPVVKIPEGPDPVARLLTYLKRASSETEHVMSQPDAVKRGVTLRGASGIAHDFDAMVLAQPSSLWSLTGWAYPGWCMLVKMFGGPPKLDELKYLKHAAEDVTATMKVPPSRVIALWQMKDGQSMSDEAYQFVTSQVVTFRHHGDTFVCSLEIVGEDEDGTYDLVPFVVQNPPSA
jgi:hypothetical protein